MKELGLGGRLGAGPQHDRYCHLAWGFVCFFYSNIDFPHSLACLQPFLFPFGHCQSDSGVQQYAVGLLSRSSAAVWVQSFLLMLLFS